MKTDVQTSRSVVRALNHEAVRPVPVWLMRQAGRYLPEYRALRAKAGDFWTMCTTPELAAEVTLQPLRRFDLDAAIVFSDILTIPSAMGQAVRIEDGLGPRLAPFPGVNGLNEDAAHRHNALWPVYDALSIVREKLSPEKSLIGFAGAPWTLATYMLGENGDPEARRALARQSPDLQLLIARLVPAIAEHLRAQLAAGADIVQLFDSWAGGLSDDDFDTLIVEPTRSVVERLRSAMPAARMIGFPRGATADQYKRYAATTDVDGLSVHTEAHLGSLVNELSRQVTLQGNLDPAALVEGGDTLDRAVDAIVSATRGKPFIFNLGHGVVPETPPEHVEQLVQRVHETTRP